MVLLPRDPSLISQTLHSASARSTGKSSHSASCGNHSKNVKRINWIQGFIPDVITLECYSKLKVQATHYDNYLVNKHKVIPTPTNLDDRASEKLDGNMTA